MKNKFYQSDSDKYINNDVKSNDSFDNDFKYDKVNNVSMNKDIEIYFWHVHIDTHIKSIIWYNF